MKNLRTNTTKAKGLFTTLIAVVSFAAFATSVSAQAIYKIAPGSQIKVSGTSNIHDWTMVATNFSSEGSLLFKNGQLQDISSLSMTLPVNNLKSKEDLMDKRAYTALKAESNPRITYKLTGAVVLPQQKLIKTTGTLSIGGVSNQIELQTAYLVNSDGLITCKGSKSIKMSDYKIKAPSFMLGALKTGNEVIIDLTLVLKKQALLTAK